MARPRHRPNTREQTAEALGRVAPLASRWVERLLATHDPPLTPAQYLALQAVAEADVVGAELARRAAISPAAVSQLLAALEDAGLLERLRTLDDRRRQTLALSKRGNQVLRSVQALLRERLAGLLADLPAPEAEALTRLLNRVEPLLTSTLSTPPTPTSPATTQASVTDASCPSQPEVASPSAVPPGRGPEARARTLLRLRPNPVAQHRLDTPNT